MKVKLIHYKYLIISMYLAGIIGLNLNQTQVLFKALTPYNLLFSFFLLVKFQENKTKPYWLFLLIGFAISYLSEIIGINTGLLFGKYHYLNTLGFKLLNTPPLIGINWLILIISLGSILNKYKLNSILKAFIAALILSIFDIIIEPVAIHLNMWYWETTLPPFKNYLDWFLVSFLIFIIYFKSNFEKKNTIAALIFYLQLVFFTVQFLLLLI